MKTLTLSPERFAALSDGGVVAAPVELPEGLLPDEYRLRPFGRVVEVVKGDNAVGQITPPYAVGDEVEVVDTALWLVRGTFRVTKMEGPKAVGTMTHAELDSYGFLLGVQECGDPIPEPDEMWWLATLEPTGETE